MTTTNDERRLRAAIEKAERHVLDAEQNYKNGKRMWSHIQNPHEQWEMLRSLDARLKYNKDTLKSLQIRLIKYLSRTMLPADWLKAHGEIFSQYAELQNKAREEQAVLDPDQLCSDPSNKITELHLQYITKHMAALMEIVMRTKHPCAFCCAESTLRCSGCKIVHYCCKEHQVLDWKQSHKERCLVNSAKMEGVCSMCGETIVMGSKIYTIELGDSLFTLRFCQETCCKSALLVCPGITLVSSAVERIYGPSDVESQKQNRSREFYKNILRCVLKFKTMMSMLSFMTLANAGPKTWDMDKDMEDLYNCIRKNKLLPDAIFECKLDITDCDAVMKFLSDFI